VANERRVTIGLIQHECGASVESNLESTIAGIKRACARGAQIVCTQELFKSVYFCQTQALEYFKLAEPIPGPTTDLLCRTARENHTILIASLFEKRSSGVYHNSAVIIDETGRLLGVYRKLHIPDDPQFNEKYYFTPGDTGIRTWDTKYGKIGVQICWDQWFPEAARINCLQGAEILFYPTAIGWIPSEKPSQGNKQHSAWETIQRSHATANGCFVASINRVGFEAHPNTEGLEFWGQSFISDTQGCILARASSERCEELVTSIDLAEIDTTRLQWPFLRDRRIDLYGELTCRMIDDSVSKSDFN
jgi:N-carbamoylputrescine amidase